MGCCIFKEKHVSSSILNSSLSVEETLNTIKTPDSWPEIVPFNSWFGSAEDISKDGKKEITFKDGFG